MRTYELMVILDGDLTDALLSQARTDVRRRIDEVSTVIHDDFEANRKFAYEINHKTHGHYLILELTAEPGALDPVERAFLIADDVVRHKVIRLPDDEAERRQTERANPPPPKSESKSADEPAADEPATETAAAEPAADEPVAEKPATEPATDEPADKPAADEPATEPAAEMPAADEPAKPASTSAADAPTEPAADSSPDQPKQDQPEEQGEPADA